MYEKFFYLRENPFHITPDTRFLYLSKSHRQAMELMEYGVRGRKGFVLMTGEVGTGKTTLSRALLDKLAGTVESALILNPVLSGLELVKTITEDFGVKVKTETAKGHLDALNDFLLETASRGGNAVIIIDEAQNLSSEALEMVRLLSNLETDREKLLQIIMVGQPELADKLSDPALRQLNQRVIVRHDLSELDREDAEAYVDYRLRVAGADSTLRFSEDALDIVYEASRGIPRMVNIICDRALTAAFVAEKRSVDSDSVVKAITELSAEGYLSTARPEGAAVGPTGPAPERSGEYRPGYSRYLLHIAITSFTAALAAGILWGPSILNNIAVASLAP